MHNIEDFGLTIIQLRLRHSRKDSHPEYTRADYNAAGVPVTYWHWVHTKIYEEQKSLDNDNPHL